MWILDRISTGTVLEQAAPRLYMVETPSGEFRRNRRHLNALPNPVVSEPELGNALDEIPDDRSERVETEVVRTRSGRTSKPREMFDNLWTKIN